MIVEVRNLTGAPLEWAVATCECYPFVIDNKQIHVRGAGQFSPLTDWSHAGPIIEREKIQLAWNPKTKQWTAYASSYISSVGLMERDTSPLVAAMRCFVESKAGEEIYVPTELFDDSAVAKPPAEELAERILNHCYGHMSVDHRMIESVAKIISNYKKC